MLFPETDRVKYAQNPLQQVICQLRFPPILRIISVLPVDFQERLKDDYPYFQEKPEISAQVIGVTDQLELASRAKPVPGFDFVSEDGHWTVSLTRDFLALSTDDYRDWQDFKTRLDKVKASFEEVYPFQFYSRIGLRYLNVIRPSKLNLENVFWSELIKVDLAGELAVPKLGDAIEEIFQQIVFRLDEYNAQVRVQHGLVIAQDGTNERCYLIDSDFFTTERTEPPNAGEILTHFNRENGNFFRSVVTDRLKVALGTSKV